MAEVAGLVLGAAGIAGLISAFKDTVGLFALIKSSADLGREFEILDIKLDIEKTLLLQWSERVGLLNSDHDQRLNDPDIQTLAIRALTSIRKLLEDSADIHGRYAPNTGTTTDDVSPTQSGNQPSISQRRMRDFIRRFRVLRLREEAHGHAKDLRTRARWAVNDKDKFNRLVTDLSHFVARLNELIPPANDPIESMRMADEDLEHIRNTGNLDLILEASNGFEPTIAESARRALIVAKLWFRRMEDRRESIEEAHEKTFQWVLEDSDVGSAANWDILSTWLRGSSNGIYWISGKAGSGKSTLMKYLFSHPRLRSLLQEWAGESPYWLCNFFLCELRN